MDLILKIY